MAVETSDGSWAGRMQVLPGLVLELTSGGKKKQ